MPATINATVGSSSANSYADSSFASTYMEERETDVAWEGATEDQQTRALIAGARALDRLSWLGRRATSTQALQWPRAYVLDPDAPCRAYVASDVVPDRLKMAQCEVAYAILAGTYSGDEVGSRAFDSVKLGDLEVDYLERGPSPDKLPTRVMREVAPYLAASGGMVKLARG